MLTYAECMRMLCWTLRNTLDKDKDSEMGEMHLQSGEIPNPFLQLITDLSYTTHTEIIFDRRNHHQKVTRIYQ